MVDWDRGGRAQTIDVLDVGGALLDSRSVTSFADGQYSVWSITGPVRFRVTRTAGVNAVVSAVFIDPVGGSNVTFLQTDTTTSGNWKGAYGQQGYALVGDGTILPNGAQVLPVGHQTWTWAASTTDTRVLQKVAGTDRIAATWYANTFTIDLNSGDNLPHRVALYMLDWDRNGRAQTIDVLDAGGAVLDTRAVAAFSAGQYSVWSITGPVRFRVTRTAGVNAVVSAVFIDSN
jgi:hypothetical protein